MAAPDLIELLQQQQRELEIEKFKLLKQQQHYHVKLQQNKLKRMSYQQTPTPPPIPYNLDTTTATRNGKTSPRHDPYRGGVSRSNVDLPTQKFVPPPLTHSNTVESFSPSHSPTASSPREANFDIDDEELAQKRRQLERELKQLKLIEKNRKLQYGKSAMMKKPSKSPSGDVSVESSYISEDMLSSKKNYYRSNEDLGKKLSRYTDEEEVHSPQYANERYAQYDDLYEEDEELPPPPPKHSVMRSNPTAAPVNVPFDADDFRFTDEQLLRLSQMQQEELKNSIKSLQSDVLNLSELSATSAGSFMRHKYERQQEPYATLPAKEEDPDKAHIPGAGGQSGNKEIMESIFQDKKSKHPNIFKKLLMKKNAAELNQIEQKLQQQLQILDDGEVVHWTTYKSDLNRMNSLTTQSKQARTKRIVREERSLIIKPLEFVSEINTNEVLGGGEFDEGIWDINAKQQIPYQKIESMVSKYDTSADLNQFIADVSVKFQNNPVAQVRATLLQLIKFRIIEEDLADGGKILQQKPKLQELMSKGEGSIYQMNYLFKKILDALRIPSEIVLGFWKRPNEFYHNEQYVINHCWLLILLDEQFFIMDMYNFAQGGVICNLLPTKENPDRYNEFYFLARPLSMVSTHIPLIIDLQHVVPPIDQNIAFYLPRMYSGFYKNNLKFKNFNNALTRLTDLEFFELELEIPNDIELFALIKTSKITSNELTLCQVYWSPQKTRIAKIKSILPENESIGVLQIFSGRKGLQKHFDNIHELSVVIPLYHSGSYKPCKFVPRFPTVQSQNNDLYIKQPQTNKIIVNNAYNFEILQHPLKGINTGLGIMNQDFKMVIESPSGKYFKLNKLDQSKPYGVFEMNVKCTEVGLYRGLVIGDNGNSWYVFAQWDCIPGLIKN